MAITNRERTASHLALLALALAVIIRTAWISDDAQITLRCVMNFISGYGPTFNIEERVQPYTHPLWFLLISGGTLLSRNVFAATFGLSIFLSLLTLWLLISRLATNFWAGMLAGAGLMLSKAYVDYSTSGLENPLSHVLLVLGCLLGFEALKREDGDRYAAGAVAVLALIYLSRPDLVLLVLPFGLLVLVRSYRNLNETAQVIGLAATPILAWTLFSIVYYGFPFPNTAYAKLGTGITRSESIRQGIAYLAHSVAMDPITLTFTAMGILLALHGPIALKAIAAGIVAYLIYVVSIGGDFMSGRFLTVPLLASAVILSRSEFGAIGGASVAIVFALLGAISLPATILSGRSYVNRDMTWSGLTDERGFMFQGAGLVAASRDSFRQPRWILEPRTVRNVCGLLGSTSMNAGPGTSFIDPCGLTDPLLARLPAKDDPNWRIGHFLRVLPSGYTTSWLEGKNLLIDPATKHYWDVIRQVTRGPLFSMDRLKAIVRLNLGWVEEPDPRMYRSGNVPPIVVDLGQVSAEVPTGAAWNAASNRVFDSSIEVRLAAPVEISSIDVCLAHDGEYSVDYQTPHGYKRFAEFGPTPAGGMARYELRLAKPTTMTDRIRITAVNGDGLYSLGYLLLNRQFPPETSARPTR